MSLSERQAEAVWAAPGGLFVSAAAGSGKTRVLTARFVRLAEEARRSRTERPLDALIAITFTEKAAGELAQRIRGTLAREVGVEFAREAERAWISTIHGLCRRLLKLHAFEAGLDPSFGVCDEVLSGLLRQQAFERALADLAGSADVERLVAEYDIADVAEGVRVVDERLRSMGLTCDALPASSVQLEPVLESTRAALAEILAEMMALQDRGANEDRNIGVLAELLAALAEIEPADSEAGASVLSAASGFKQNKSCRSCAKPLALDAEALVKSLVESAASHAASVYENGFAQLLSRCAQEYEAAKADRGVLDFEDLQLRLRDLLEARPDLVRRYRKLLMEVMVDEFQDTNELQLAVVSTLAGDVLATVGDEKQSIYGWRNADIEVFRRRRAEVDASRVFSLPENYRSHPELVAFYNAVFSAEPFWPDDFMKLEVGQTEDSGTGVRHEPHGPDAGAGPYHAGGSRVRLTLLEADACAESGKTRAEADAVAEWFSSLREAGAEQRELVLLLRAMTRAEVFEAALRERGFDVYVASGGTFFETREVSELKALLRVVANTRDDEALARVLVGRMANLTDDALYLLRRAASADPGRKRSLWDAATDQERPRMAPDDEVLLARVIETVSAVRREQGRTSLYELIHAACEALDYDLTLFAAHEPRAWANALKFARMAEEFERLAPGDPGAFLDYLEMRQEHQRYEQQAATAAEEVDAVRIMSVHSAKGLEFPVVALAELASKTRGGTSTFDCGTPDGQLTLGLRLPAEEPFCACRDTAGSISVTEWRAQRELDESKRVLYVAATRATEALGLFAVTDSAKEQGPGTPIAWITQAIGLSGQPLVHPDGAAHGEFDVQIGGASVRVCLWDPGSVCEAEPEEGAAVADGVEVAADGAAADAVAVDTTALRVEDAPGVGGASVDVGRATRQPSMRPDRISFTGLRTYLDCSYRYYATYIARLGRLSGPSAPGDPISLGAAVHEALRFAELGRGLAEERLRAIAARAGLGEAESERMRVAVERALASPVVREALSAQTVFREVPFGVDIDGTTVDGAIDLLAMERGAAVVVDYKTGESAPDAAAIARWRLQAACYATAVLEAFGDMTSVDVVFYKPEANGHEERFVYARSDLPELRREIGGIIDRIAEGDYPPLAAHDRLVCSECPALGSLCPVRPSPSIA